MIYPGVITEVSSVPVSSYTRFPVRHRRDDADLRSDCCVRNVDAFDQRRGIADFRRAIAGSNRCSAIKGRDG